MMKPPFKAARFFRNWWSLVTVLVSLVFIFILLTKNSHNKKVESIFRPGFSIGINQQMKLKRPIAVAGKLACIHPKLELWDKVYAQVFHHVPAIKCGASDWLYVDNGTFHVQEFLLTKHSTIHCKFAKLIRMSDLDTKVGDYIKITFTKTFKTFKMDHDFYKVLCEAANKTYDNVHAGVVLSERHKKHQKHTKSGKDGQFNVLMIGLDSLSHMTYMRKLPKTYKYFTRVLNGVVLDGYNIVGDGTPQALIPILTGKTELELPRTLKRLRNAPYVDVYPMIWKNFTKKGYVTAWAEDNPFIGTFTYRMTGFKQPPVNHYMRPFYVWSESHENRKHKKLCLGDKRRTRVYLNWLRDVFIAYTNKPKWVFGFHSEVSHGDNNLVETADEDLTETLKFLKEGHYLDKTILILMSDHGARFASLREQVQGKQEERRPFFGIYVPKMFKSKYPKAYNNLKTNVERLSSPFDVYPTFVDILNANFSTGGLGDIRQRSISLFQEIPKERTCDHAGIEAHWCACLNWDPLPLNDPNATQASKALVEEINKWTLPQRKLCRELHLQNIKFASKLMHSQNMLKFKRSNDLDGYKADLSGHTKVAYELYQIQITTMPGYGHFEATLKHDLKSNKFIISLDDVSRTNKYGDDPHCIYENHEELRKYCYCKDKKSI